MLQHDVTGSVDGTLKVRIDQLLLLRGYHFIYLSTQLKINNILIYYKDVAKVVGS